MSKYYAGCGNGSSTQLVCEMLKRTAEVMAKNGYILRTGGTKAADESLEKGCDNAKGKKEVYLPFEGYNDNPSKLYNLENYKEAENIAKKYDYNWTLSSNKVKSVITQYSYILLGRDLNTPAECLIACSNGRGTCDRAINLAKNLGIPVYDVGNLYDFPRDKKETFVTKVIEELKLETK